MKLIEIAQLNGQRYNETLIRHLKIQRFADFNVQKEAKSL